MFDMLLVSLMAKAAYTSTEIFELYLEGVLEQFQGRWGGNLSVYKSKRPNRRATRRWEVVGVVAATFLEDILPFTVEKRLQIELGISYQREKCDLGVRGGKGYTQEQRDRFSVMELRLKELKRVIHVYV